MGLEAEGGLMILAILAAATLQARIEDVRLFSADTRAVVRISLSRAPADVVVERDGELTRVSLRQADLGITFSGGDRFQWLAAAGPRSTGPGRALSPDQLVIERDSRQVSLLFRVQPDVSVQLRRDGAVVFVVFQQQAPPSPTAVAQASPASTIAPQQAPPAQPLPSPSPAALQRQPVVPLEATRPARPEPGARLVAALAPLPGDPGSRPAPAAELLSQLLRTLTPSAVDAPSAPLTEGQATEQAETDNLYRKLFPRTDPTPPAAESEPPAGDDSRRARTFQLGMLAVQPALRVGYVDASASLLADTGTVRDRYLEVQPGVGLGTGLGPGRIRAEYEPSFRAFASFGPTQTTTQHLGVKLELPAEGRFRLTARDAWIDGVLEASEVDPGGEYFFDLHRFRRNSAGLSTSYEVAASWTLEAGAGLNRVRFRGQGPFFDYETRTLSFGLGHELSENLRASLAYVRDQVPGNAARPQAESTANGVQAVLAGDPTPLLSTQLTFGYRDQENPLAGQGGRRYRGLVFSGSLTQALGLASSVTLSGSRAALLSAFEENGYYVSQSVQGSGVVQLPRALSLDASVGYRSNSYRTVAGEIGAPRADGIFDWAVGLRRALDRGGRIGLRYQRQRRRSNIDRFDTTTDRLDLEWDFNMLAAAPR
jgi:hypothetical protein